MQKWPVCRTTSPGSPSRSVVGHVDTGFAGAAQPGRPCRRAVPPPAQGPPAPVTAIAMSAPVRSSAPIAICRAVAAGGSPVRDPRREPGTSSRCCRRRWEPANPIGGIGRLTEGGGDLSAGQ